MRQRGKIEGIETLRIPVAAFQWNKGTIGCLVQAGMYVDPGTTLWLCEFQSRRFTGYDFRHLESGEQQAYKPETGQTFSVMGSVGKRSPVHVTFLFDFEAILVI